MICQRSSFQLYEKKNKDFEICKTNYIENKRNKSTIGEVCFETSVEIERGNTRFIFK